MNNCAGASDPWKRPIRIPNVRKVRSEKKKYGVRRSGISRYDRSLFKFREPAGHRIVFNVNPKIISSFHYLGDLPDEGIDGSYNVEKYARTCESRDSQARGAAQLHQNYLLLIQCRRQLASPRFDRLQPGGAHPDLAGFFFNEFVSRGIEPAALDVQNRKTFGEIARSDGADAQFVGRTKSVFICAGVSGAERKGETFHVL